MSKSQTFDSCCQAISPKNNCKKRKFRDNSSKLSNLLINIKKEILPKITSAILINNEESKYKNFNYNGLFHKGLAHNLVDGRLMSTNDYDKMKLAIYNGHQQNLLSIPLAPNSTTKLVNPLSSYCTMVIGAQQDALFVYEPPSISSATGAAEMLELYAQAIARDIPFINYDIDQTIGKILDKSQLNNIFVLSNLKYALPTPFTIKNIFRGNSYGDNIGPYISQLLYLNVILGAIRFPQQYYVPPTRKDAKINNFRVEWGINLEETINMQNGNLARLPPLTPSDKIVQRYIYSGRALAEAVHIDPVYQFFYQASLILSSLGAKQNSGLPVFTNQSNFITSSGPGSLQCMIAEVTGAALKHAWYWKWQHYRKLRPETFALWVHDVKTGLVPNEGNFDISNILLSNQLLDDILNVNASWLPGTKSYTLPQAYREGAPLHPSYMSGHATIAGACCTILKIYFDPEQSWLSLPGVIAGSFGGIANHLVQANPDGTALVEYNGIDAINATVGSEINKLGSNVAVGRNFAGIHYRSDAYAGLKLGEEVAIHYMEDVLSTMIENMPDGKIPKITFRKFDGTLTTIKPTCCY